MFISNNHQSCLLPRQENLVKHQKVSKYYENDCLQNFLLLFRSLLTPKFVKNIYLGYNFLSLSKKRPKTNLKFF